jgi:hypothetical protein
LFAVSLLLLADQRYLFFMLQAVLGNSKWLEEGIRYYFLKPWLGNGLFTSTGNHSNIGTLEHLGKNSK